MLYEKQGTNMPNQLEQSFDPRSNVIRFSAEQIQELKNAFDKFDEGNTGILKPCMLKDEFRKLGYD